MAVRKNIMIRVGADMSGLVSAFQKAGGQTDSFKDQVSMSFMKASDTVLSFAESVTAAGKTNSGIIELQDQLRLLKVDLKNMEDLGFGWGYAAYEDAQQKIQSLSAELKEYINDFKAGATMEAPLVEEVQEAASSVEELSQKSSALKELAAGFRDVIGGAGSLGSQLKAAQAELKAMEKAGLGAGDSTWNAQYQEVERLKVAVKKYKQALTSDGAPGEEVSVWRMWGQVAGAALRDIGQKLKSLAKGGIRALGTAVKNVATGAFGLLKNGVKSIGSAGLSGLKSVGSRILSVGKNAKNSESSVNKLLRSLRNVGIAALGIKVAKSVFGELRSVVLQYLQTNETLNARVEQLKSSMGYALAPAINLVTNALGVLMPYVVGVSNAIGSLLTNLFGEGWTTVAEGATAAAAATGGAAAAQAEYNRQILGFDEITKLQDQPSGGGGGGGSSDVVTTPVSGKLPTWLTDMASQIKAAVEDGDWYGVGEIVAGKMGDAVEAASTFINTGTTKNKIFSFVRSVTSAINGFFDTISFEDSAGQSIAEATGDLIGDSIGLALDTIDRFLVQVHWDSIGTSIAQFFNGGIQSLREADNSLGSVLGELIQSGIEGAKALVGTFDWSGLGSLVARNVNDFFGRIDWGEAGMTLSDGIKGALNSIRTAIRETDWQAIGEACKEFFGSIDWSGIGDSMIRGFGEAVGGLGLMIVTAIGDEVKDVGSLLTDHFGQAFEDCGGDIFAGILVGIGRGVVNIGKWIKEEIFDPFVDGFKSVFSIHSPSTDPTILSLGENVMEGIKNGIIAPIVNFAEWVDEKVWTPIKDAFRSVFGKDEDSPKVEVSASAKLTTWRDALNNKVVSFQSKLTTWRDALSGKVVSFQSKLTSWRDSLSNKVVSFQSKLTSWRDSLSNKVVSFQSKLTSWRDSLSNKVVSFQSKLTSWRDALRNKTVSFQSKLTSWRDSLSNKVVSFQSKLTTWKDALRDKTLEFKANVKKGWTGSLADKLGISSVTTWINFKAPKLVVDWGSFTFWGNTYSYPKGFDIVWNARGGILNGAQLFGRMGNTLLGGGEAGKEAVLPLERNTWWMDTIARKTAALVGGSGGSQRPLIVQVLLDGRVVGETAVEYINGEARTTGVNPLSAYI